MFPSVIPYMNAPRLFNLLELAQYILRTGVLWIQRLSALSYVYNSVCLYMLHVGATYSMKHTVKKIH